MRDARRLLLALVLTALLSPPAAADFATGLTAYQRGDEVTALREWTPLAEAGDAEARFRLWQILRKRNYLKALVWLMKAGEQGHIEALNDLAGVYLTGRGLAEDRGKALELYREAAGQGLVEAQKNLGHIYLRGKIVKADPVEAAMWYRMAAEQDDRESQAALGDLFAQGLGVPRDKREAAKWHRRAAGGSSEEEPAAAGVESAKVLDVPIRKAVPPQPPAPASGAEAIRLGILDYLKRYAAFLSVREVRVQKFNESFLVRLAGVRYPLDENLFLDIERVGFSVEPAGAALYKVADVYLPREISVRDKQGAEAGRASIHLRRASGLFSVAIRNFLELDSEIADIRLSLFRDGTAVHLEKLFLRIDREPGAGGLWNLFETMRGTGLRLGDAALGELAVAAFDFEARLKAVDIAAWASLVSRFEAEMTGGSRTELLKSLLALVAGGVDFYSGFEVALSARDLSSTGNSSFRLAEIGFRFSGGEAGQGLSHMRFTLAHSGLALNDSGTPYADLTPQASTLDVAIERFPGQTLTRAVAGLFAASLPIGDGGGKQAEQEVDMAGMKMLSDIRLAMAKAGTTVGLSNTSLVSRAARIELSGEVTADANVILGAVGGLDVRVAGLDAIAEALMAEGTDGQGESGLLATLRSVAKRSGGGGEPPIDDFHLELARDGALRVNDVPLDEIVAKGLAGGAK
jgi:hypothetical protein